MEFMTNIQGGVDELKPSLFELLAEQQLSDLLPPSLRYILALATHRHPRYLLRLLNSFDEVYALLMLAVERHYLKTYGGSFTENFYGLKRERVLRVKGGEVPRAQLGAAELVRETLKLGEKDVWKNLAILVGLPYLKRKLDESYDIHAPQASLLGPTYGRDSLPYDATVKQRILYYYKWFLRKIYPNINAAYYFALLAFNLAYLFDGSKYHSPFFWTIGSRMRRLGMADQRAIEALTSGSSSNAGSEKSGLRPGQSNSILNPRIFFQAAYPRLLSSLRILLPTSIFALKFLEWWHASDFARQLSRKAAEGLELPPPIISGLKNFTAQLSSPTSKAKSEGGASDQSNNDKKQKFAPPISSKTKLPIFTVPPPASSTNELCPICLQPITTATASPYGYVYCYACIHKWLEGVHSRQEAFMEGGGEEERAWRKARGEDAEDKDAEEDVDVSNESREGSWENGKGRCAVSGRKVLGGTEGLRRVVV